MSKTNSRYGDGRKAVTRSVGEIRSYKYYVVATRIKRCVAETGCWLSTDRPVCITYSLLHTLRCGIVVALWQPTFKNEWVIDPPNIPPEYAVIWQWDSVTFKRSDREKMILSFVQDHMKLPLHPVSSCSNLLMHISQIYKGTDDTWEL